MMLFRAGLQHTAASVATCEVMAPTIRRSARAAKSSDVDVLLLDGETRQTLAAMRAYARAGLRVGAVTCASDEPWAPSLRSRACSVHATVPDYNTGPDAYVDAVVALLDQ